MHQTFDRSVPLSEQRLRVALKKSTRNHPKRHSTAPERVAKAKKQAGARKAAKIENELKRLSMKIWSAWYYSGSWL